MSVLKGKNAFVTGGGSGIGLACAKAFAADGANVLIMGRNAEKLAAAADELRSVEGAGQIQVCAGDVALESDVEKATDMAAIDGALEIAVANAGTGDIAPIMVADTDKWDEVVKTNLNGSYYTIKYASRWMSQSGGGAICTISSIAGVKTHKYFGAYCSSKAAINMLAQQTADELGVANIRVNSVCPGLVETELASGLMNTEEVYNDYMENMPISRHGRVEDIANAVRFLCGPESTWVTGTVLSVDGGHHLRRGPNYEPFTRMLFGDDLTEGRFTAG